jgi:UDP-N-acetylglucosamine pyrophosphorylase
MLNYTDIDVLNPFKHNDINTFDVLKFRDSLSERITINSSVERKYQVVILAAGKGTRMQVNYPKMIYQLEYPNGKSSVLNNTLKMIDNLKTSVDIYKTHIVINEKDTSYYDELDSSINIITLHESDIRGTAVCINSIKKFLDSKKDIIFIWGDLALWRASDLNLAIKTQELFGSSISFPTRLSPNPYVAFLRSSEGKFTKVVHSNETNNWEGFAEQDCLSFVCKYESLSRLNNFINKYLSEDKLNKFEVDFIHYLPFLANEGEVVIGIPIVEIGLIFGLNTVERAKEINDVLSKYSKKEYNHYFGFK